MSAPWSPPPGVTAPDEPTGAIAPGEQDRPGEIPPSGVADTAPAPVEWRRLHKVTPALNAWKAAAVLLGIAVWNYGEELAQLDLPVLQKGLFVIGAIVLGALIGLGYGALAWRRTQYGISADSVFLHSGVLWRQQRHVRLDRLQAVDVTQPLLARLFGFSSLKIESAGGAGSNLTLSYLTDDEAQRVRNEILARAAGVKQRDQPAGSPPVDAEAAPERQLLELSSGRLIGSLLRSAGVMIPVLLLVGLVVVVIVTQTFRFVAGALPAVLAAGGYVWSRFAGEFSFRIGISADGIRLRHGLLEAKARTVPPGRVQAIALSQPLLWRSKGWWRLRMNVAGYGAETGQEGSTVLFPVATTEEVQQILPLVLSDLGTENALETLQAAMTGSGDAHGFVISPPRAKLFDPFSWRRQGIRITETALLLRSGVWWRYLAIVPHERSQSIALTQGPIERRRKLAGLAFHSTAGPVRATAIHLDVDVARDLLLDLATRARDARRRAAPERWMQRAEVAAPPVSLRASYAGVLPTTPDRGSAR